MSTTRLTDLPIKHLEYVFSPPGLPLPAKGEADLGTTSILVRGGPGAGKTTFALALAHGLAKHARGLVLYLTTEFSPVEIVFKATLIGLPEEAVDVWPGGEGAKPGHVVVHHLTELRQGKPVLSSAERRAGSIDAVWGLLHAEREGDEQPKLPVRAVVIDALTLPEPGEKEGTVRADLVAFVQALEGEGRSVVLVEELGHGSFAWSSFVVDVVFELSFMPDTETGELHRKLTLTKSRHALSIPGPHDYGLDGGVPSAWPDLFRIVAMGHRASLDSRLKPLKLAPDTWVPAAGENQWARLRSNIVLSYRDKTAAGMIQFLNRSPGLTTLTVECGAETSIGPTRVYDSQGPHAIGWSFLDVASRMGANVCLLNDIEALFARPGGTTRVIHLLEGIRSFGFMVCVHSTSSAAQPIEALADYVWGGLKLRAGPRPRRSHRAASRWFASKSFVSAAAWLQQPFLRFENTRNSIELKPIKDAIENSATGRHLNPPEQLALTTVRERLGQRVDGTILGKTLCSQDAIGYRTAWLALHSGADWHAARLAFHALTPDNPEPTLLLLWQAVCAAIAKNPVAIDGLKASLGSPDEPLILDPLLRGLAGIGLWDDVAPIIAEVGTRHSLDPWMLDRLRADARLDSDDPAALRDAVARLTKLTADDALPLIHRAETWFNLGTAHDRLSDPRAAIVAFEQASALNPYLDAAREELSRLRDNSPAPTTS